jgi:formamidopyrimidine-DNA glycosylase
MPELPEVEVTARALDERLRGKRVDAVRITQDRLRWPIPAGLPRHLQGQVVSAIERRGKYLLWYFPRGVMLAHLGMSGSWRVLEANAAPPRARHDHVEFAFGQLLARYHDPRRFGALLWHDTGSDGPVLSHPLLTSLGIEPFDSGFDGVFLYDAIHTKQAPIKTVLLGGQVVVGVGNIYASECLFAARIHPQTPASTLGKQRCQRLADTIRHILARAIEVGGSSLRDFTRIDGVDGNFLSHAQVYGREQQPCHRCGTGIRRIVQGQRATYFCPRCQRRPTGATMK